VQVVSSHSKDSEYREILGCKMQQAGPDGQRQQVLKVQQFAVAASVTVPCTYMV
jgi:hypothetical protein